MNDYLTEAQRIEVNRLIAMGFTSQGMSGPAVKLHRGNDHRIVQLNGQVKRAYGARR